MASTIDFTALDLRGAFDFAIMIEEDAQVRYERLSALLGRDPGGAGDVFRAMVANEGKHRSELVARRDALFRDGPPRIEISVLDDAVEAPEVDEDELPRSAREALEVSLAAEQRAYEFFEKAIPHLRDLQVRAFFADLMREEAEHASLLAARIALLGDQGGGARAPALRPRAPVPAAEAYPDHALLQAMIPRFDAATQAVASSVIVAGADEGEVASGLGVSRRTVSRKLAAFVRIARLQIAAALAVATLAGALPARAATPPEGSAGAALGARAAGAESRAGARLAVGVRALVATRMPRHGPSVHRRLAQAILAEAELAGLDPLLVLALIHVESSFDPAAVSSAGAVGLMQLVEPTLRREIARSGLRATDPRDPVTNVRAGVRYLRRLIDAFGEVDVALMAYNAGPNRIRGHLRRGEIPVRFQVYPRKVNGEVERLRMAVDGPPSPSVAAGEQLRARPVG